MKRLASRMSPSPWGLPVADHAGPVRVRGPRAFMFPAPTLKYRERKFVLAAATARTE